MRRVLAAAACMLVLALAGQANAKIINGQFVPDGLANGVKYRLIFVTSGTTLGTSGIAGDYDTFATAQANAPNSLLGGGFDYGWQAVLSTYGSNGSNGRVAASIVSNATTAIYNTRGIQVGDNGADMLDGNLDSPVQYDQHGTSVENVAGVNAYAWTGSSLNGQPAIVNQGLFNYDFRVGAPASTPAGNNGTYTYVGDPGSDSGNWLAYGVVLDTQAGLGIPVIGTTPTINAVARVYAMSTELTAVPEPATLVMWSLFAGVAGLVFWRKGRKTS